MAAEDRLQKLERQRAEIERKIRLQKEKLRGDERKKDTRRKIILGGLVEKHCSLHPDSDFAREVQRLVAEFVTGDRERELFNLPPRPAINNDTDRSETAGNGLAQSFKAS